MKLAAVTLLSIALAAVTEQAQAQFVLHDNGNSRVSLHGLVQTQAQFFRSDSAVERDPYDGKSRDVGLERFELALHGEIGQALFWRLGYETQHDPERDLDVASMGGLRPVRPHPRGRFLDAFVGYRFGDKGRLLLGQYRQPMGLEELIGEGDQEFVSKSLATRMHALSHRLGAAVGWGSDEWGAFASVFDEPLSRRQMPAGGIGSGFGLRAYLAPAPVERGFVHLGLSYTQMDAEDDLAKGQAWLRTGLQTYWQPHRYSLSSGLIQDATELRTIGAEFAYVSGPFKLQSELFQTDVKRRSGVGYQGRSGYVAAAWNLSGNSWRRDQGLIARETGELSGWGDWELVARYERVELDDNGMRATWRNAEAVGDLESWTVGANWRWGKHLKLSANLIRGRSDVDIHLADQLLDVRVRGREAKRGELQAQLSW